MDHTSDPTSPNSIPIVRLTKEGARLVKSGSPWLRSQYIEHHPEEGRDIASLFDPKGIFLGTALYAKQSRVPIRLLSFQRCTLDRRLLSVRMRQAQSYRENLFRQPSVHPLGPPDSYRMVHSEADQLPGLFIDRYGEAAVIQTSTAAMDLRKRMIAQILVEEFGVKQVVSRDDGSNRDLEHLPRIKEVLLGSEDTVVTYHDAGSLMETDLLRDGKTGAFLDQQENHAWCFTQRLVSQGPALDVFTYHGGFALALARAGFAVLAGDENPEAIRRAKRNASLNQVPVDFQVRNAFDWLRDLERQRQKFSFIVVDPPALAKRGATKHPKASMDAALRAYKELNLRALRCLSPAGILIACSCSGNISPLVFAEMLYEAAQDAGCRLQLIERRNAAHDHPPLLGLPETDHLKCFIVRMLPVD